MNIKNFQFMVILFICATLNIKFTQAQAQLEYAIHPDSVLHKVDEKVYGQFLEHIYNSTNNGLWGDLVWNRSFEMFTGSRGEWAVQNGEVVQSSLSEDVRLLFGDVAWQDYEFRLQALKDGGGEGFLIIFRANGKNFYWCNLGGWNNTRHAIEKGVPGARWSVFNDNAKPGSINTGQWYDIRIRCEGKRFQVWMDTALVFDFTDDSAHLSGQVGIGTWKTSSRYRNFLVTNIGNGDTLFNGVPQLNQSVSPANWKKVGSGILTSAKEPLNSNYCIKVTNSAPTVSGIRQDLFYLKKQMYSGSFWAKGTTPSKLKIELLGGDSVIVEKEFPPPAAGWQENKFELLSTMETTGGALRISFNDTGALYLDQVSMMGRDAAENNGFRPDLYHAVKVLNPPVVRWPGGCYASAYFWKDGIGPQHMRKTYPIKLWNDRDVNSYGTDEFLRMCQAMGAEPIIALNSGILNTTCGAGISTKLTPAEYLQDAMDWMEYCNGAATTAWGAVRVKNGHPEPYNVKYWEIDNETWLAGVNAYIAKVKEWAPVMRAKYPGIKIIVCGSGGFDQSWNRALIADCADLFDYISVHHYEKIENFKTGVVTYGNFLTELEGLIASSSNPAIKIYMSEWNVWNGLDWRSGLYAGGMLNMFEKHGKYFEIGGPALFLRHSSADNWNNAFINFDNATWFPAANYVVMKFWRDHFAPNFVKTDGNQAFLNLVTTLAEDGKTMYVKMINTTANPLSVSLNIGGSFMLRSAVLEQIAPAALSAENTMSSPSVIQVSQGKVNISGRKVNASVPEYGAAIATISQEQVGGVSSGGSIEKGFGLHAKNPFLPNSVIRYNLLKNARVNLRIVDIRGRLVSELVNGEKTAGTHFTQWDGRNTQGVRLYGGLYFIELLTPSERIVKKMVLIR